MPHLLEVADIADKRHRQVWDDALKAHTDALVQVDPAAALETDSDQLYSADLAHSDVLYEHKLCDKSFHEEGEEHWADACHDIVDTYGLDSVEVLMASAPSTLCAHVKQCRQDYNYKEESLDEYSDVLVGVGAWSELLGTVGAVQEQTKGDGQQAILPEEAAALKQPGAGGNNGQGMASMMYQQQAMDQQAQQEEQVNNAVRKIRRAEARNRALRRDLRELRKETWRSKPGNCDCCDACLPPVTAVADKQ
eukprot:TRINITY_DN1181_c0_g1_i1.p1 TRINITY_DN1181_c0_g1~~TRINITY_DN1181_c0_g1_i1.p1  ORF type:complete len:250 (+),score=75.81 TRINITY_DN1181_c0_g1_i1:421-1170(+)